MPSVSWKTKNRLRRHGVVKNNYAFSDEEEVEVVTTTTKTSTQGRRGGGRGDPRSRREGEQVGQKQVGSYYGKSARNATSSHNKKAHQNSDGITSGSEQSCDSSEQDEDSINSSEEHELDEADESPLQDDTSASINTKMQTKVCMFEFKQNDPKMDTGMKICRLGLATARSVSGNGGGGGSSSSATSSSYQGIVLSSETSVCISPKDRDIIEKSGIAGINCSWNRLTEIPFQKLGKQKNHRTLPYLLAANDTNYGKPYKLSTAEAIAACLWVTGFKKDAELILSKFKFGDHFIDLNREFLELYSCGGNGDRSCDSSVVRKLERTVIENRERQRAELRQGAVGYEDIYGELGLSDSEDDCSDCSEEEEEEDSDCDIKSCEDSDCSDEEDPEVQYQKHLRSLRRGQQQLQGSSCSDEEDHVEEDASQERVRRRDKDDSDSNADEEDILTGDSEEDQEEEDEPGCGGKNKSSTSFTPAAVPKLKTLFQEDLDQDVNTNYSKSCAPTSSARVRFDRKDVDGKNIKKGAPREQQQQLLAEAAGAPGNRQIRDMSSAEDSRSGTSSSSSDSSFHLATPSNGTSEEEDNIEALEQIDPFQELASPRAAASQHSLTTRTPEQVVKSHRSCSGRQERELPVTTDLRRGRKGEGDELEHDEGEGAANKAAKNKKSPKNAQGQEPRPPVQHLRETLLPRLD
ncbi:unnamed protein product [Amoebophrya sp. A120]|nr:unnamed protein product [Amoebophrya sp. A120]|eukprot:GSA120T00013635001.1